MPKTDFHQQISRLTSELRDKPLDENLELWLNREHGPDSATYRHLKKQCEHGISEGWLCQHSAGGIAYGRAFKPSDEHAGFSIDVVDMENVAGPHHSHPNGEIDLIMPLEPGAKFDGRGAGWLVYPPESAHRPTLTHGRALVLYLLPEGKIQFTA